MWEPPAFELAERNGQLMSAVITGLLFCTGMPVMLLFSLTAVALQLVSDRWMLRRICRRPPKYSHHMHDVMMSYLPLVPVPHLAIGIWMLGYPGLASWTLDGIKQHVDTVYTSSMYAVGPRLAKCVVPDPAPDRRSRERDRERERLLGLETNMRLDGARI